MRIVSHLAVADHVKSLAPEPDASAYGSLQGDIAAGVQVSYENTGKSG